MEIWEADDFDPWNTLRWETVRVFFYRQHKPDGKVVEAYWLTNFPSSRVGPQALFRMAKSRWEIGVSRKRVHQPVGESPTEARRLKPCS